MERADVRLENGLLAHLHHVLLDVGARLVICLLYAGGVDATVLEKPLQGEAGDLPPHAVEAGEQHGTGRVVDDEVDAGERLEGADVAALTADDAPLELVRLELDHGDGRLDRVAARHPLHDRREDAPGPPVGIALGLLLDLPDEPRALVLELVLQLAQQDLLGLAGAEPGEALELADLLALRLLQRESVLLDVTAAVLERALPLVELLPRQVER